MFLISYWSTASVRNQNLLVRRLLKFIPMCPGPRWFRSDFARGGVRPTALRYCNQYMMNKYGKFIHSHSHYILKRHQIRKHCFKIFSNKWFPWHVLHKSCMQGMHLFSTCALSRWFSQCRMKYHNIIQSKYAKFRNRHSMPSLRITTRLGICISRALSHCISYYFIASPCVTLSSQLGARCIIEILPW